MKSHDLIELKSLCEQKNKDFKNIEKECFDLTEEVTKKAIQDMEKACELISNVLKQGRDSDTKNE